MQHNVDSVLMCERQALRLQCFCPAVEGTKNLHDEGIPSIVLLLIYAVVISYRLQVTKLLIGGCCRQVFCLTPKEPAYLVECLWNNSAKPCGRPRCLRCGDIVNSDKSNIDVWELSAWNVYWNLQNNWKVRVGWSYSESEEKQTWY